MSYQALARKWRPRLFEDVVGQEHVVAALANALDHDRVHHAFLFSGTRGVGKTTLARILAKALNCERGASSKPCNECGACVAIDEGRFVDLIEVDAASRTKVDDTRELLDNVQYAPTQGRYKIYLIDEVHMLSGHSFNALLKTLEEPPPHVKFLLATTDPQKLPVTVLSRCLQFNLKALHAEQIAGQLEKIVDAEQVPHAGDALALLARAADGSMRDALSLLDQAIAHGGGELGAASVRTMLGMMDATYVPDLISALAGDDADGVLRVVAGMAERAADYAGALDELLLGLFHLSLYQVSPEAVQARDAQQPWHEQLAQTLDPEDLQLFYQIGLIGKRDLPLAPDPRSGFEMVLLRMLAFRPAAEPAARASGSSERAGAPSRDSGPGAGNRRPAAAALPNEAARTGAAPAEAAPTKPPPTKPPPAEAEPASEQDWSGLVARMSVGGLVRELAANTVLHRKEGDSYHLVVDGSHEHLLAEERRQALEQELGRLLGRACEIKIGVGSVDAETPAQLQRRAQQARQAAAENEIRDDPGVKELIDRFGATVVDGTVEARDMQKR
jgi:DNA polymerase-3 subunit gamma/tau